MSATFKNSKKKLSQLELRKFMHEHKSKSHPSEKINSPLAKYNEAGQLTCVLCQSIVRSEAVWSVHINAKQHRQNVEQAKALKEKTNNFTKAVKRAVSPSPLLSQEVPNKKMKGILKNAPIVVENKTTKSINKTKDSTQLSETETERTKVQQLPADFFDAMPKSGKNKTKSKNNEAPGAGLSEETMEVDSETLPEGFFDDPKLDAKARNIEFKDPIEEEWERFQKEIKNADHESAVIIAEDQEEATTERQIDEIEEQMKNWSRVVELEKKKVGIVQQNTDVHMQMKQEDISSSSDDEDIDEFLDWRAKRAF